MVVNFKKECSSHKHCLMTRVQFQQLKTDLPHAQETKLSLVIVAATTPYLNVECVKINYRNDPVKYLMILMCTTFRMWLLAKGLEVLESKTLQCPL
ncbi:hypothetical protein Zmor_021652 [Zophobas morio]|uniref:Uncharacterized protein n=1 Tax=Zophobas morio TaxID=2755281 RepID=A0AA38I6I2_9CUCU|nr:hypothetical protein Zmor_021652 [Zophobas morio]